MPTADAVFSDDPSSYPAAAFKAAAPTAPPAPAQTSSAVAEVAQTFMSTPAALHRTAVEWLVPLCIVAILMIGWWFGMQSADTPQPAAPHRVIDKSGRAFSLTWSSDPIDPRPVIEAHPPLAVGGGTGGAGPQHLFGFAPQFAGATCAMTATQLKQALFASVVQAPYSAYALTPPPGMHSSAMKRLAITPRFLAQGTHQKALRQAALWLTPYGLVIGDPRLDAKVSAQRTGGPEAAASYPVLSPGVFSSLLPATGGAATTATELMPPSSLHATFWMPNPADRAVSFRTAPWAFWNWNLGRIGSPTDTTWPFAPTFADTPVLWSQGTPTGSAMRWLEFLQTGDLRVVDRDPDTGTLTAVLWTASGDTNRAATNSVNGCV